MEGVTSAFLYGRLEGSTVKELGEGGSIISVVLLSLSFLFSTNPGTCTETERLKINLTQRDRCLFFLLREESVKCLVSKISIGFEFTFRSI